MHKHSTYKFKQYQTISWFASCWRPWTTHRNCNRLPVQPATFISLRTRRCPSSERVWFTRLTKRLAKFELIAETLNSSSRRKHIFNFNCLISDFVFYPVSKHFKQYILKKHWTTHSLLIIPEYVWYVYLHVSIHVLYCKWFVLIIPLLWIMIVYSTTVIAQVKKCRGHL